MGWCYALRARRSHSSLIGRSYSTISDQIGASAKKDDKMQGRPLNVICVLMTSTFDVEPSIASTRRCKGKCGLFRPVSNPRYIQAL